ncbi:MAG: tyrosine-type recombinase/integrase [Planctomycetota bacterium]|jgi:integrase/recombinase XerD
MMNVNLSDLDIEARELIVRQGKGKKDRLAFIDIRTQALLHDYLLHARPQLADSQKQSLIVRDDGTKCSKDVLQWIVKRAARAAKLNKHISVHSFRRTFCSQLLKNSCSLVVISELAGHKRLSTTGRYQKLELKDLRTAYQQAFPRV